MSISVRLLGAWIFIIRVLLLQLHIPQLNYGRQTGNIPWAKVTIVPESTVSFLGHAALLHLIGSLKPDIVDFSIHCWNLRLTLHLAKKLKSAGRPRIIFGGPKITADNRAVLLTLVTRQRRPQFTGTMQRQVYWWEGAALPDRDDLRRLAGLDGLLVDADRPIEDLRAWQYRFAAWAAEYLHIGFADAAL